ncbi:uncharacterized protein LOC115006607 [Cottoperca gobio]|uniref:Uncharacterized protein LOC115006607 n=1 Tax=Cottoperca gobio TaxID=56716 RepID=A0A6J2PFC4_COTGO|nr:uncharacterized protein LOC115006607 [Cottoperca gobio]
MVTTTATHHKNRAANMNSIVDPVRLIIFYLLFVNVMSAPAANSPSALTCDVTQQPNGLYLYQLSRAPSSSNCSTCWEDREEIIARDSKFNKPVQFLTNQSITLNECKDYLHYTQDCTSTSATPRTHSKALGFEEAHCKINCSHLMDPLSTPVNSTLSVPRQNHVHDGIGYSLVVVVVVGVVVGVVVVVLGVLFYKRKRKESLDNRVSYTPAIGQINIEGQEMAEV